MKRPYQIAGLVFLLFAAFMTYESLKLQFYTSLGPGPGFFPLWVSLFIGLLGGMMLYQATFRRSDPMGADFKPDRAGFGRVGAIVCAMVAVILLMDPLGFRLTIFLFLLFLLLTLGRRNLIWTLSIAVLASLGIYHAFVEGLEIPLPIGVLGI